MDHLESFSKEALTVVTAEEQTSGRGTKGRSWLSPKGENLYMSLCFFAEKDVELHTLTRHLAESTAQFIKGMGLEAHIKWPNDLMIGGKKVAGILTETRPLDPLLGIVIGLGLNVNMSSSALADVDQPATSLREESGRMYDIDSISKNLIRSFEEALL